MDDAWGTSRFGYDPLSRLSRRRTPASDTVYYAYDGLSNPAIVQYPRTGEAAYFAFDSASRMSGLVSPVGYSGKFLFDPKYATLSRRSFGNGTAVYYMYDGADRVVSIRHVKSDGSPLVYFEYGRDRAGRIVTVGREGDLAIYYGYDAVNRLTSELWARKSDHGQIYGFWYDYDTAHNRTKMRREFGAGSEWDSAYFGYAADNSLTKRQTNTLVPATVNTYYYYDANGALVRQWDQGDADATYFWYGAHKLVTALKPPGTLASYFYYDGQLNRYCINNAGTQTYYLWDGLKLLEERKADSNLVARYTHGYAPNADIGGISEVQRVAASTTYYQYLHMDHRGTVYAVSDAAGAGQLTYTQDAFGRQIAPVGGANPAVPNDNIYQTNWKTMEFGSQRLMLSKYRVDDPSTGVFGSRDLTGTADGSNQYIYCHANPVNDSDVNGLWDVEGMLAEFEKMYGNDNAAMGALFVVLSQYQLTNANTWANAWSVDHAARTITIDNHPWYWGERSNSDAAERLHEAISDEFRDVLPGLTQSWKRWFWNRGAGGAKMVGGTLSIIGGGAMVMAPEPTMLTKVGGYGAAVAGADLDVEGFTQFFGIGKEGGTSLLREGAGAYGRWAGGAGRGGEEGEEAARYWVDWARFALLMAGGLGGTKLGGAPLTQLPAVVTNSLRQMYFRWLLKNLGTGVLTKPDRLKRIFELLKIAPPAKNAEQAMSQMNQVLEAVEDAYSGTPKLSSPPRTATPRMYAPQADSIVRAADGTITATARSHTIVYGSNGSITVIDRATGTVVFSKVGE